MFEPSKESNLDSPVSKFLPVFLRFTVGYNYSSFRDFFLVLIKNHFFDAVKEKAHQKKGLTTLILSISAAKGWQAGGRVVANLK